MTLTGGSESSPSTLHGLDEAPLEDSEVVMLQRKLEAANSMIARMDQQLSQTRITKHTLEQALGSPSAADATFIEVPSHMMAANPVRVTNIANDTVFQQTSSQFGFDKSNTLSPVSFESYPDMQRESMKPGPMPLINTSFGQSRIPSANWDAMGPSPWSNPGGPYGLGVGRNQPPAPQPQRPFNYRYDSYADNSHAMVQTNNNSAFDGGYRRNVGQISRPGSAVGHAFNQNYANGNNHTNNSNPWTSYPATMSSTPAFSPPMTPMSYQSMNSLIPGPPHYQPRPIGTPLSPTAMEFSANALGGAGGQYSSNPWNPQVRTSFSSASL